MKFFNTCFSRQRGELRVRQAVDEQPPVRFRHYTRIEDRDEAAIACGADQSPDSLAELHQRIRQRELVEGIAAALANVIAARLGDGVRGWIERETRDNHLRERIAGNIDTVQNYRAKQDRVSRTRICWVSSVRERSAPCIRKGRRQRQTAAPGSRQSPAYRCSW